MKPIEIKKILDLALQARKNKQNFVPMFTGDSGLGKSAISQQWVNEQRKRNPKFGYIDFRMAYQEAPDIKGFAEIKDGRTTYCLPSIFPTDPNSEGLLSFEEINRANNTVMNTAMQILTDRKIEGYSLPEGWIIIAPVNGESEYYDVNKMDAALLNRFIQFEVEYDQNSFIEYMRSEKFHPNVINFIISGNWQYKKTSIIGDQGKYISPRSWDQMNAAENAGASKDVYIHKIISNSILGNAIGKMYHSFVFEDSPITNIDIIENLSGSLNKLRKQSFVDTYQGDRISVTISSIVDNFSFQKEDNIANKTIGLDTMVKIVKIIPADLGTLLITQLGMKSKDDPKVFIDRLKVEYPELSKYLKDNIRLIK